jgi:hypothetical protein
LEEKMKSVHIVGWGDLKQFGINSLTGEACGYSMRLLCDLSEEGADLIRRFFGMPYNSSLCEPWNSKVDAAPTTASIMLPRGIFDDLCQYILFSQDMEVAIKSPDGTWSGYADFSPAVESMVTTVASDKSWSVRRNPRVGTPGDRNQHAFTGRIE